MIAYSLFADLRARGVRLSVELGSQLRVQAPPGALNGTLRSAIREHKADLLQFVYELEERQAILEIDSGLAPDEAAQVARQMVRGGLASPDGDLWLRAYAQAELDRLGLSGLLEIVDVRRLPEEGRAKA
jgi:hypothetical protein